MYIQQLIFDYSQAKLANYQLDDYTGRIWVSLYQNGQCEDDPVVYKEGKTTIIYQIRTPERNSLSKRYFNESVKESIEQLKKIKITFTTKVIAKEFMKAIPCKCKDSSAYILYASYSSGMVRCSDCFCSIPLYKLPPIENGNCHGLLIWNKEYNCCDDLQMSCGVLEKKCMQEMSKVDSDLSKDGLEYCQKLAKLTGKAVYYYLCQHEARSHKQELVRKCPGCGGDWLLDAEWHLFRFRCDSCHLVSNFAYLIGY